MRKKDSKESWLQKTFLVVSRRACSEYHAIVVPQKRPCPDSWFGTIGTLKVENAKPVEKGLTNITAGRIVLVLESPHINEYKNAKKISPIQGQTGKNVEAMLLDVVGERYSEYHLYVVNAIRYQCSQGLKLHVGMNGDIKDYVFGNLLTKKSFQNDFADRLKMVFRADRDIVINACTDSIAWNLQKGSKETVRALIQKLCDSRLNAYHELPHPASWKLKNLEALKKRFNIESQGSKES